MDADCLFCKIVAGEIPADIVHDSDGALAFTDVNPQAPVHVLVIPKQHVADVGELAENPAAGTALLAGVRAVADQLRLSSYRTVLNTGGESGQTVFHVHAHLLAGRRFGWPPG
ncbi:MAG: histidine triad nucleotide-binding protein [Jatrophihabitantaceae bacterium]